MKKKFLLGLSVLLMISCCGCTKITKDILETEVNEAQNEDVIDLEDVMDKMEQEQEAEPSPTVTPEESMEEAADADEIQFPEQEQVITEEDQTEPQGHALQLVFLGDSIFDNNRDGTGVPYLTSVQCDADVYNLAIAGTTATVDQTEPTGNENWSSRGMMGVVKAMQKVIPTDIFEGTQAKGILDNPNVDFSKTDYFILEYGINDYFEGRPISDLNKPNSVYNYVGAWRCAISELRNLAPDCTIVICPPHYCLFFNGDRYVGDSNMTDKGFGTLRDYMEMCEYVAGEQNTLFLNTYYDLGINGYTTDEYLEDGIHLTAKGRQVYADALAKLILAHEEEKNN